MSWFMGIFGGAGANPGAALVRDGTLVALAEEERFNRRKGSSGALPLASMAYCLDEAGIRMEDVEAVGFAWDCERYVAEMPDFLAGVHREHARGDNRINLLAERRLFQAYDPDRLRFALTIGMRKRGHAFDPERLVFLPHHPCHVAATFYASGFDDAAVVTLDGSGEETATALWACRLGDDGPTFDELARFELPHTLGGYYATFTEFLGFRSDMEEGKLMGLAAYGRHDPELQRRLARVLDFDPNTGDYTVDPTFRFYGERSYGVRFTDDLVALLGPPRLPHEPIEDAHRHLAFNVQWRLEQVAGALVGRALREAGSRNLCLAGGVAMNCKMNGALASRRDVDRIHVPPGAGDAGVCVGAAYLVAQRAGVKAFEPPRHAYWGPAYDDAAIEAAIREAKLPYRRVTAGEVADLLVDGRIVGWFQGRMEAGARALGGRSILANPLLPDMQERLNRDVKHREAWRPFCPSVTVEAYPDYFGDRPRSDYMILAFPLLEAHRATMPAVVHVDGTARPQTVHRDTNAPFHALLTAFAARTGHPVLLNTSFNVQGEPIVRSPTDALRCFGGTGIDALVLGDYLVCKPA